MKRLRLGFDILFAFNKRKSYEAIHFYAIKSYPFTTPLLVVVSFFYVILKF